MSEICKIFLNLTNDFVTRMINCEILKKEENP